jgi:hypothetical protein
MKKYFFTKKFELNKKMEPNHLVRRKSILVLAPGALGDTSCFSVLAVV